MRVWPSWAWRPRLHSFQRASGHLRAARSTRATEQTVSARGLCACNVAVDAAARGRAVAHHDPPPQPPSPLPPPPLPPLQPPPPSP
eukprot:1688427-Pleurochrysis_carterae.AAC.1